MYKKTIFLLGLLVLTIIANNVVAEQEQGAPLYDSYFGLSLTRSESGEFIPAERLGSSEYCGHCHTEIFQQWNASTHHFSSFNNPVYRKVALEVDKKHGRDTLKFCASCHDPLPLLSGELDTFDDKSWSSTAGITCLACHRITQVHGKNGEYVVDAPILHPFALSDSPVLQSFHETLIDVTPWLHTEVLSKPFYSSPEYCETCHSLEVPEAINHVNDIVLLNEYGDWKESDYAKKHTNEELTSKDGLYKDCMGCHMPLVPSNDPAAKDGFVRSHSFSASNTALPTFNRDTKHLDKVEAFLKYDKVKLEILSTTSNDSQNTSDLDLITIGVNVANKGVGHNFPAGTTDSNEVWLQVKVTDANKRIVFTSGDLDNNGEIEVDAEKFGSTFLDIDGNPTDRRNTTTEAVLLHNKRLISAGGSKDIHYSFELSEEAIFPLLVDVQLNWRKYDPKFMRWVFDNRKIPDLPVTVIDKTSRLFERKSVFQ